MRKFLDSCIEKRPSFYSAFHGKLIIELSPILSISTTILESSVNFQQADLISNLIK